MIVKGIYLIYPRLGVDTEYHSSVYAKFIDHFKTSRQIRVRGSFTHDREPLLVRSELCSPQLKKRYLKELPFVRATYHILEFSGSFEFPGTKRFFLTDHHTGAVVPHPRHELRTLWRSSLPNDLDLTIQTYLCALMIAFPGAVRVTQNVWLVGRELSPFRRHYVSVIHEAVEHLVKNGLNPKTDLDAEDTAQWVFSQGGLIDGYSNTPVARALNYFTRIFTSDFRDDEISNLVWALAGIEALLVEGGRSSRGQLREKFCAIFEAESSLPWILDASERMYIYRSKMVHGDRQLRSAFRFDETEDNKRFHEEYYSELFAIGMLVILLQHAIAKRISAFRFKTIFEE